MRRYTEAEAVLQRALATLDRPTDAALDGLSLAARFSFGERTPDAPEM